ncbi:MerR family transcriptional regulator [Nocardia sp. R16R-3T]
MKSRNSAGKRTIDVARAVGYSVQQVRKLELDGVLPVAVRTSAGYRVYDQRHVHAARAYRSLAAGAGPIEARKIMRAANAHPISRLLAHLDAAHATLDRERRDLEFAKAAARAIVEEPCVDVRASDQMTISELADALGIRLSTLRHWDAVGLVVPERDLPREARRYTPSHVRDARIVHQLRLAGYRITQLQTLMPQLRGSKRWDDVVVGLDAREASIEARSRALLEGAVALNVLISQQTPPESSPPTGSQLGVQTTSISCADNSGH